jgi:Undecaprenyl-phosphate galactose phosphotransferase WbaP
VEKNNSITLARLASDCLALVGAFVLSTAITEVIQTEIFHLAVAEFYSPYLADRLIMVTFLGTAMLVWFASKRHYTARRAFWTEIRQVFLATAAIAAVDGWLHFALKMTPSRLWQVQLWIYAAVLIIVLRMVLRAWLTRLGLWQLNTLVIGTPSASAELCTFTASEKHLGYKVCETLALTPGGADAMTKLPGLLRTREISHALIACEGLSCATLDEAIRILDYGRVSYGLIPSLRGMPLLGLEVDEFFGYDFIVLQSHRRHLGQWRCRAEKRCIDVACATLFLLAAFPILAVIAALVKLDGGPILYRSLRIGYGGSVFWAYKFRTMVPDADRHLRQLLAEDTTIRAEWEQKYKLNNDPRVTWIGRYLRRSSLDELPQLINVLRGEMSLVGPRPVLVDEANHYGPWFDLYTKAVPGITGVWQVSGRDHLDYEGRIHLNNWYIRNWSVWHDVVILLRTIVTVTRGSGAS